IRPGRPRLNRNSRPRRVLWEVIETFRQLCHEKKVRTFLHRRVHLLKRIEEGATPKFSHIFVDEVQDCTPADFQIFRGLLADPYNLFVTGDLAQAVHMGRSASGRIGSMYPEAKGVHATSLHGSFRLPFRSSEALIPLSKRIREKRTACGDHSDVVLQHPYKGSPPGVRPIIVAAQNEESMANKLLEVAEADGQSVGELAFDIGKGPILLEWDQYLRDAAKERLGHAASDTILRLKGLEYPWVVWSRRTGVAADEDAEGYVYTILTRV